MTTLITYGLLGLLWFLHLRPDLRLSLQRAHWFERLQVRQ